MSSVHEGDLARALELFAAALRRRAGEAGYVCLTDVGTRWARFIRHRRMLERVT